MDRPRRRLFQFGLGTLLLVVTAVAVFLAYHLNWIQQRHALIARQKMLVKEYGQPEMQVSAISVKSRDGPGLLGLFGERAVIQLILIGPYEPTGPPGTTTVLPHPPKHPDYQRARQLFPEVPASQIVIMGLQKAAAQ